LGDRALEDFGVLVRSLFWEGLGTHFFSSRMHRLQTNDSLSKTQAFLALMQERHAII